MTTVKIRGSIGSWFATAGDKSLPIMWADQMTRKAEKFVLRTDWLENSRETNATKRNQLIEYFEPHRGEVVEIILANAKNPDVRPREIKDYVAVFEVDVINVTPEIELVVRERIADAR
jgi:hypothetical protein